MASAGLQAVRDSAEFGTWAGEPTARGSRKKVKNRLFVNLVEFKKVLRRTAAISTAGRNGAPLGKCTVS